MKRLYLFALALAFGSVSMAQQIYLPSRKQSQNGLSNSLSREQFLMMKGYDGTKATGGYYLDYEAYDASLSDYETFVENSNSRDTTSFTLIRHYVGFDTLVVSQDGETNFEIFSRNDVVSLTVDSIIMTFHHQNTSGTNDTLNIRLISIDNSGRPTSTILWSTQVITDSSLTGLGTPQGYPIRTFAFPCGFTLTNNTGRFGIDVEYAGALEDTFSLRYGYPTVNDLCGAGPDFAPVPSEFYPASFYRIALGDDGPSIVIPTTAGVYPIYLDCNGNNEPDGPEENGFQNWAIWTYITLTEDLGIGGSNEDMTMNISPNPSSDFLNVKMGLEKPQDLTVTLTDLSGKQIVNRVVGHVGAGDFKFTEDISSLSPGVYLLSVRSQEGNVTRRIIKQ